MAENAILVEKKGEDSEFSMKGLLNRFRKKKNSKKEEYSSQVHPTIPSELSQAWEVARPYRPSMVLNLQTITEEDPSKTPSCQDPLRTPLYFTNGTHNRRFRFRLRRYTKLIWRTHYAARLRHNFKSVLRIFRTRRETKGRRANPLEEAIYIPNYNWYVAARPPQDSIARGVQTNRPNRPNIHSCVFYW